MAGTVKPVNKGSGSVGNGTDGDIPVVIRNDRSVAISGNEGAGKSDGVDRDPAIDDFFASAGADGNSTDFVSPSAGRSSSGPRTGAKPRGRPAGARNGEGKRATPSKTTQDLTGLLIVLHLGLSKSLKAEELELDEKEAKSLSDSILRLTELYDIPLPSEKVMAWIMLGKTAGTIYGPRLLAMKLRQTVTKKPPSAITEQRIRMVGEQ